MIMWLDQISKKDVPLVGGKGASLGELSQAGKQVPPGFSITVNAYRSFATSSGISERLNELIVGGVEISEEMIKHIIGPYIQKSRLPSVVEKAVRDAYLLLCSQVGNEVLVAVRSSATMEDGASTSFAGQHETFLNVSGIEAVLAKTLLCWGSMFSPHALHYRNANDISLEQDAMAVVVQKMVNAKSAGVAFTVDPVTGERDKVVINSAWGLGEGVVGGFVTPDHFVVDKKTLDIKERWISPKTTEFTRDSVTGETVQREVLKEKQMSPSLTIMEVKAIAQNAISIEQHYGQPQDIEWAFDRELSFPKNLLILQSRPVTVWGNQKSGC